MSFPHLSPDINTVPSVKFIGDVHVDEKCKFDENAIIDGSKGRIVIEKECRIGKNSQIISEGSRMKIGYNVEIGENCLIRSGLGHGTIIGNNVKIESNVEIGEKCIVPQNSHIKEGYLLSANSTFNIS